MSSPTQDAGPDTARPQEAATMNTESAHDDLPTAGPDATRVRIVIAVGVVALIAGIVLLQQRAASRTNHVALAASPRPVSVQKARAASYRPVRTYVGTTEAWNVARVGPQYVSAYVATVLVRPGAVVKAGQVLATLDCKSSSAASREIAARARALEERQSALEHEAARVKELTGGGFASQNELEQLQAKSSSEKAEIEGLRASLVVRGLEVDDCILRAPFAGEVSDRTVDPGAYVRPGNPMISVIDRSTVRVVADAPEADFTVVAAGTAVDLEVEATGKKLTAHVSRRAPATDDSTRTVHFEIDLPNAGRELPVGATARLTIEVGEARPAALVALRSATLRGDHASLFTVDGAVASQKTHRVIVPVLGERGGSLYLDPQLAPGTLVVVEGRALLDDGDAVTAQEMKP